MAEHDRYALVKHLSAHVDGEPWRAICGFTVTRFELTTWFALNACRRWRPASDQARSHVRDRCRRRACRVGSTSRLIHPAMSDMPVSPAEP